MPMRKTILQFCPESIMSHWNSGCAKILRDRVMFVVSWIYLWATFACYPLAMPDFGPFIPFRDRVTCP